MNMSKFFGLIVLIIIIAAVVGGVFWWNNRTITGNIADYVINGQIVTNEKAGLSFEVPNGWIIEKIDELEGSVIIYSPDTKFIKPKTAPIENGCLIGIGIVYKKTSFEELKQEINDIHYGLGVKSDEFEIITINNTQAMKNIFDTMFMGRGTSIYIPHGNKLYSFVAHAGPNNEQRCLQNFDEFLDKVYY